jgi:hypothetical protein
MPADTRAAAKVCNDEMADANEDSRSLKRSGSLQMFAGPVLMAGFL